MTENNRIEYKRELNERLEKEVLKGEAIISGAPVEGPVRGPVGGRVGGRVRGRVSNGIALYESRRNDQRVAEQPRQKKRGCVLKIY